MPASARTGPRFRVSVLTRGDGREGHGRVVWRGAKVPHAMYRRRALIIGIAGQDGSLLSELLLAEGYEVFGVVRQPVSGRFDNLEGVRDRIELMQSDVLDELSLVDALTSCRPHEVYNLASPSFVPMSWRQPVLTAEFAAVGCTALLEAIVASTSRSASTRRPRARSSASRGTCPRTEETPLAPVTPYGARRPTGIS